MLQCEQTGQTIGLLDSIRDNMVEFLEMLLSSWFIKNNEQAKRREQGEDLNQIQKSNKHIFFVCWIYQVLTSGDLWMIQKEFLTDIVIRFTRMKSNTPSQSAYSKLEIEKTNQEALFMVNPQARNQYFLDITEFVNTGNSESLIQNNLTGLTQRIPSHSQKKGLLEPKMKKIEISYTPMDNKIQKIQMDQLKNQNQIQAEFSLASQMNQVLLDQMQAQFQEQSFISSSNPRETSKQSETGESKSFQEKKPYKGFLNTLKLILLNYFKRYYPDLKNYNLKKYGEVTTKSNRKELENLLFDPQLIQMIGDIFSSNFILRHSRICGISPQNRPEFIKKYKLLRSSFLSGKILNLS